MAEVQAVAIVDARGKTCPEPLYMMKQQLDAIKAGEVMEAIGDQGNKRSMVRFIRMRRHELLSTTDEGEIFHMLVRKSENARTDIPISQCVLK